jgi:hypothetical protein
MTMLLGLTGRAGSGKSTVADLLVKNHGFVAVALADPIKRICKEVFGFTDEQLWGPSERRNAPDKRFPREHTARDTGIVCDCCGVCLDLADGETAPPCYLTPRYALQRLGTEWGRSCYENAWINHALWVANRLLIDKYRRESYNAQRGLFDRGEAAGDHDDQIRGMVISDVRFSNEADAIRVKGGRIWKTVHGSGLQGAPGAHDSEQYIDSLPVDAVVPDSPLEALPEIVAGMLEELR